ncbi:MAG: GNAT family N-acetyltransferase [Rubrivivax sp.]|jgi:ribosomal protein S18 acetylase RimI-like enzyme
MTAPADLPGLGTRAARPADAQSVADVFLASRRVHVAFAPLAHSEPEVRDWIAHTLLPAGRTRVAEHAGVILGFAATSLEPGFAWLDHLYLAPDRIGQGWGTALLHAALADLPSPTPTVRLYCFQANRLACRFYERHGFVEVARSDGRDNEERCPDVLYERR